MKKVLLILLLLLTLFFIFENQKKEISTPRSSPARKLQIKVESTKRLPLKKSTLAENRQTAIWNELFESLPRQGALAETLSDFEMHQIPESTMKVALKFAQIADDLSQHPEKREAAADFYRRCASDDTVMSSVRAVCWNDLLKLGFDDNGLSLPDDVRKLAAFLRPGGASSGPN